MIGTAQNAAGALPVVGGTASQVVNTVQGATSGLPIASNLLNPYPIAPGVSLNVAMATVARYAADLCYIDS